MYFICSITHTLIRKKDRVRIIFIESHNEPSFPFMNYNQPTSTGNFTPMGCAYQAEFADDDHNEYFTFDDDKNESILANTLIDRINKRVVTKSEATSNNLLTHNSKNSSWGEVTSLEDLFRRCNSQSVYLNDRHSKNFPFISVMVMHESAYQLIS